MTKQDGQKLQKQIELWKAALRAEYKAQAIDNGATLEQANEAADHMIKAKEVLL